MVALFFYSVVIKYLKGGNMARIIVVTSGKGGVGKTTVCANLGYALASMGLKVLMLDGDFGLNNLDVVMGVENKAVFDIVDVLNNRCRPRQALVQDFFVNNLFILPSNHAYVSKAIDHDKIKLIINELGESFDYVLLDCPAGIEGGFHRVVNCAHEAIIVTTPHLSALRDADKVVSLLQNYEISQVGLIINRARGDMMIDGDMLDVTTIKEYLNVSLIGVLPDDDNVTLQLNYAGRLNKDSEIYKSFSMIADNIHHSKDAIYDCTKKYKGLLGGIKKSLRRVL